MRFLKGVFFAAVLLGLPAETGLAQEPYPSKPVRMITTVAAGGAIDVLARGIAKMFADRKAGAELAKLAGPRQP